MLRLLRDSGFDVAALVEVQIPEGATTRYPFVSAERSVAAARRRQHHVRTLREFVAE